jgi:predicted nuclease of restriction endonuclease-like RecB superfamily
VLTADLVRPRLQLRKSELSIDMLDEHDFHWQQTAQDLIALLQQHIGQSLAAWDRTLDTYLGERVDYVVVRGLAKVLTDAATFTPLATPLAPVQLRERLFASGPVFTAPQLFHQQTRYEVVESVSKELAIPSEQVEATLFADRPATYLLTDAGPEWTPAGLIARYNLELARGVLYWASHVRIEAHSSYKDLWKYMKLFKLMFEVQAQQDGYLIDLDGPISPFVHATTRYGRQFAAFLPALLLCEQWRMVAAVHPLQMGTTTYRLDHSSALQTHFKQSGAFDSRLEADFAREFEEKFGNKRGQWLLTREDEVLPLGDTVMIPDFALTHKRTGHRVLIELVGFWHPDYLRRKVEKLRAAQCHHMLLLVYEGINLTPDVLQDVPSEVLYFKQKPVLKEVMAAVETIAERVYGLSTKRGRKKSV